MSTSQSNTKQNPYSGLNLTQVLSTMAALLMAESLNSFRMGLLYIYVVDSSLLDSTKFKTPLDFFCSNFQEVSRSALSMYGAVARVFTEELCQQFGMTRLNLLLSYKKAAKIDLNYEDPGSNLIQVPDESGELKPQRFADCTVEDLRKAVAHLRTPPSQPIPDEHRALYDGYLQAVMSHFPKGSPSRVKMRTQDGMTLIGFDVPILEVITLVQALVAQLSSTQEVPEGMLTELLKGLAATELRPQVS